MAWRRRLAVGRGGSLDGSLSSASWGGCLPPPPLLARSMALKVAQATPRVLWQTHRVLNIVVSEYVDGTKTFWAMNYLTAPHVTIWSAACASCAVPGIYEHIDLVAKNNVGDLQTYYPAVMKWGWAGSTTANERGAWERLSELFNINYFILSETNLNVVPMLSSRYEGFLNTAWEVFREEMSHRYAKVCLPDNVWHASPHTCKHQNRIQFHHVTHKPRTQSGR